MQSKLSPTLKQVFDEAVIKGLSEPNADHDDYFRTAILPKLIERAVTGEELDYAASACCQALYCYNRFRELKKIARESNRKSGWAWHMFKSEFGVPPRFEDRRKVSNPMLRRYMGLED